MIEIYEKISKLSDFFTEMCYCLTKNKTEIDDAVQELMLYFMTMNKSTLKKIWEKDHTFYDTLIENNSIPVHFTEQVITTQFYHLTSLSGLYNMIHNKKSLNVYNFKDFTTNYIKNLHYINNAHPLVDSFKKIYNSLI